MALVVFASSYLGTLYITRILLNKSLLLVPYSNLKSDIIQRIEERTPKNQVTMTTELHKRDLLILEGNGTTRAEAGSTTVTTCF